MSKNLQITFLLIAVILISGCTPKDKAGEASSIRTVPVAKPQVAIPAPIVKIAGPPEKITVVASPNTLRCGEKIIITVTVKDSAGQNVRDNTKIELSQSTNPPWRLGSFEQQVLFTVNGVAQTTYQAYRLPSYVQISAIIAGLFGLTDIQVIC